MNYTKVIKRETKVMALVVAVLVVLVTGASYAMFMRVNSSEGNEVVTTGDLRISYSSTNGYINGNTYPEILPLTNEEGLAQTGYTFSVENIGSLKAAYAVYLYVDNAGYTTDNPGGSLFDDVNSIKLNLVRNSAANNNVTTLGYQYKKTEGNIDKYEIYSGDLNTSATDSFSLKIWLDESIDVENIGKYVYLKLEVQGNVAGQREASVGKVVTFDPNGGTVSFNQKTVVPGENYGELPTPTRDGYTFVGWNGKNKFDGLFAASPINMDTDYTNVNINRNLNYADLNNYFYTFGDYFSAGKYTFSINSTDHWYSLNRLGIAGTTSSGTATTSIRNSYTWTQNVDGYTYFSIERDAGINNYTDTLFDQYDFKLQIEEGEEATEYEPYIVTSNTKVTQTDNHTLTAIWRTNS